MHRYLIVALAVAALGACAPVSEEAREAQAKPISCDTAEQDIATLEKEKADVADRVAAGARFVLPPVAVIDVFVGYTQEDEPAEEWFDGKKEVASGEYNEKIDAKIAQIKEACNLS